MTRFPTAQLLLQLWERPWSTTALRHAHHRIRALYRMGLDVLDVGCGRAR